MNRKTKIIVSVVGILIVTLALLGITYAYYLTRIEGNTNTNSISLTTANLLLKYDDGTGAIVEKNIMPGRTFTKTFSVTNEGNAKIDNYVVYLEDVINDLSRTQDLTYTLTCDNCSGSNGVYPKLASIIATNSIEVGETHNYTLKVTYENLTNIDQSIDMGSTINGYIQIYNLTDIVDITGSVVNATDGDYVQINSEPKISQIVDGKYMLGAIEPGNHTITVRYKDSNGQEQIRSTKDIVIQKGNEASVSGNTITITNDSQTITINVDASSGTFEISESIKNTPMSLKNSILSNGALVEKFSLNETTYTSQGTSVIKEIRNNPDLTKISDGTDETNMGLFEMDDDYTNITGKKSVYFRGPVKNNYINFNNMCWRIVRIQGDGNVRLILASADGKCIASNLDDTSGLLRTESKVVINPVKSDGNDAGYGYEMDTWAPMDFINGDNIYSADSNSMISETVYRSYNFSDETLESVLPNSVCYGDTSIGYLNYGSETLTQEQMDSMDYKYTEYYYNVHNRLLSPSSNISLICDTNLTSDSYLSYSLNVDEVVLAGGKLSTGNQKFYLIDNAKYNWTTVTKYGNFDDTYKYDFNNIVTDAGMISSASLIGFYNISVRPVITIDGNLLVSGTGVIGDAYEIIAKG